MLQWHRHRFPPKSTCEQNQPKQIHLQWSTMMYAMSAFFMFLWHVSQQFPKEGQMQPVSSVLAKWLFSIPLLSPNLEDNSHLAGWSSESKYVSCFPNMEVSKISMISPKLCPRKIMSWFEMMSVIYLKEILQKRPVLLLAARLLFGGNSYIARTPGAGRPAVPLHLGHVGKAGYDYDISKYPLPCKCFACRSHIDYQPRATHVHCIAHQEQWPWTTDLWQCRHKLWSPHIILF